MRLVFEKGVWFDAGNQRVAVDPHSGRKKADVAIISHGHSDHVSVGHKQYLMTLPTYELLKVAGTNVSKTETTEFGKMHPIGDVSVSFENSGHVLGSGQVVLDQSTRTVITGDFKCEDSLLLKGAKPISCDTLVMETTFGLPQFAFPPREEVYAEMGKWIDQNVSQDRFVVLAGYALGKSQELTRIVNDYSDSVPLVHERVFDTNRAYERFGVELGEYMRAEHNLKDSNVLIMPPSLCNKSFLPALEFALQKKVVSAIATGWNHSYGFDKSFCLSDHCDFNELLEFVAAVAPKQVYTMHGYAEEFAHTIRRRLNIPARPLTGASQQTLAEFALQ
ncbi:MAG: MBL fold metallo-hydrolase [Candidatus Diapherotrites archaeon]|nr:MBL fold metallo-hydrolase [Candidatus Diapherotrites archaeon]